MSLLPYFIDLIDPVTEDLICSFVPKNLNFTLNEMDVSTVTFEIDKNTKNTDGDPVITGDDFISPKQTQFALRYGAGNFIMGGIITSVEMEWKRPYMSVSGADWWWYLDQRFLPFDGRVDHANDYVIGTPAAGAAIEITSADVGDVISSILDLVLARPGSPTVFTYGGITGVGVTVDYYRIDLTDTTTIKDIIVDLCTYHPGVAIYISPSAQFFIATPRWYGDPDAIANDPTNSNLIWTIDDDLNPALYVGFTNTGPASTHIMSTGAGTSTTYVDSRGNVANEEAYYRLDKSYSFDKAYTRDALTAYSQEQLALDLNPVHEIPVSLDPHQIDVQAGDTDGFFWDTFFPGFAFWIDVQLLGHHIDSAHHIVQMDATVAPNGACTVAITSNQIYDTSGDAQVQEG